MEQLIHRFWTMCWCKVPLVLFLRKEAKTNKQKENLDFQLCWTSKHIWTGNKSSIKEGVGVCACVSVLLLEFCLWFQICSDSQWLKRQGCGSLPSKRSQERRNNKIFIRRLLDSLHTQSGEIVALLRKIYEFSGRSNRQSTRVCVCVLHSLTSEENEFKSLATE